MQILAGDARRLPLPDRSVDLVVTSPPYWRKRDYGHADQIGQEGTPTLYVDALIAALKDWARVLRPTGSIFLNIGDTYWNRGLASIPSLLEAAAQKDRWILRNRIIWAKTNGMPEAAKNRLANRHEYILHLVRRHNYYYDLFGYAESYGSGANPGDVWSIMRPRRNGDHLATFPEEIAERAVTLACPFEVCPSCGRPRRRIVKRTTKLDPERAQARRAMELAAENGLTAEHLAAVQATGVSDAGIGSTVQNQTGTNSAHVQRLAAEAKRALRGYFREFTFAKRESVGWTSCLCGVTMGPGVVLDPFMGSGSTLRAAQRLGRQAIGVDLLATTTDSKWNA